MGRLAGFRYKDIIRRLKIFRQAEGPEVPEFIAAQI